MDLANDLEVGDFSAAVRWDLVIGNGEEGAGAFDALTFIGTGANALAVTERVGWLRSWHHSRKLPMFSSKTDAALLMVQAEEAQCQKPFSFGLGLTID